MRYWGLEAFADVLMPQAALGFVSTASGSQLPLLLFHRVVMNP